MSDSHIFVFIHIVAGSLGILSGALALSLRKGSRLHRQAGNVFFASMLGMSALGAYMAFVGTEVKRPNMGSVLVGILTFYLVLTAWLSARRKDGERGLLDLVAFLFVLPVGVLATAGGLEALQAPLGLKDGVPAGPYFFFGSIALMAAALDVRFLLRGVYGAQRIARHVWRMCLALWFGASFLFLGQPQVFPVWLQRSHLLLVPSLVIGIALFYWLIRVLFTDLYKRKALVAAADKAASAMP